MTGVTVDVTCGTKAGLNCRLALLTKDDQNGKKRTFQKMGKHRIFRTSFTSVYT
jgi:hypothetical protein